MPRIGSPVFAVILWAIRLRRRLDEGPIVASTPRLFYQRLKELAARQAGPERHGCS
jgi:hypothetical protein